MDWHQVVTHTLWPHSVFTSGFLLLGVALIGTTVTPYIQLYEAGAVVDKGVQISQYRYQRVDAIGGAIISDIVSMTIIIATAAAIGGSGVLTSATQASHALEPVAGRPPWRAPAPACSARRHWPPPWCLSRRRTRWPR